MLVSIIACHNRRVRRGLCPITSGARSRSMIACTDSGTPQSQYLADTGRAVVESQEREYEPLFVPAAARIPLCPIRFSRYHTRRAFANHTLGCAARKTRLFDHRGGHSAFSRAPHHAGATPRAAWRRRGFGARGSLARTVPPPTRSPARKRSIEP